MPEAKRRTDVLSLETLDTRVTALEQGMEILRDNVAGAVREIQANTRLTEETHGMVDELKTEQASQKSGLAAVKADTASIVTATKWAGTTKRALMVLCVIVTALSTAMLGAIKVAHELGWLH